MLTQEDQELIAEWEKEIYSRARSLCKQKSVWKYFKDIQPRAKTFGIDEEMRLICLDATNKALLGRKLRYSNLKD